MSDPSARRADVADVADDADVTLVKVERTRRSRIRRHAERSRPEIAESTLRAGRVAHVAYAIEGQPYVLPMAYWYEDGILYLHGAPASRTVRALAEGAPVCIEVTLLAGLVASRDAKSHSMNYRSVMVFGRAEAVREEAAKRRAFEAMTARYFPGRMAGTDYLPAAQRDLRAVELLAVAVEELSAKARSGPPLGKHDGDDASPFSSYVVVFPGADA
jgi:nitroimidazol reductase NimA-like FMN-containing flavoprotein (pyridoxamine 5'-phosphate oxidase superfamily)